MDGIVGFHDAIRKCEYCDGSTVEPPRQMRCGSKNQLVSDIRGKIAVFD